MNEVRALLETALFDDGGESVEGAFVDRWVANRDVALDELETHVGTHGWTQTDQAVLLDLLGRHPPPPALAALLNRLAKWLAPLRDELLRSPAATLRAGALRSASASMTLSTLEGFLRDPSSQVRMTALDLLGPQRFTPAETAPLVERALSDDDPAVRAHAARRMRIVGCPADGDALARRFDVESDAAVRRAILEHVADAARRTGIHVPPAAVRERIGEPLVGLMLGELAAGDAPRRMIAARGLERVGGDDVARALLQRLEVETDREVVLALLARPSFARLPGAFETIAARLRDPDAATRVAACWLLEAFPADRAVPLLREALADPTIDRPAIMVLGRKGDVGVLPRIVERFADPGTRHYRREIKSAIQGLAAVAAHRAPRLTPELVARIRSHIEELPRGWPADVARGHDALPLHASGALYLWSLRSDGTVLESDLDTTMNRTEPVTDPLVAFCMILRGAHRYPELTELLHPPHAVDVCEACLATGRRDDFDCGRCRGLGWFVR